MAIAILLQITFLMLFIARSHPRLIHRFCKEYGKNKNVKKAFRDWRNAGMAKAGRCKTTENFELANCY
jgi:hypothetical protein